MKNRSRFATVFNRRRTKSKARRTKHRRFSTFIERLEARHLLAVLLVNSTADGVDAAPGDGFCDNGGGVCTLRGAIQESNALPGTDTVSVPAGTYALTIPGSVEDGAMTGDLDITDDVIISGAGAATTIVDASAIEDRVFHIPFTGIPKTVSFLDVTIRGGLATDGGLFLIGSAGGGILSEEPGTVVTLADSIVTENTAQGTGFLNGQGGGVAAYASTLTITNSEITNNDAIGDVGAMGRGGGLYTEGSTTTMLIDSVISGNQALGGSDTIGFEISGAGQGGGIFSNGTTWSMVGSTTIDGNLARGGDAFPTYITPGGDGQGGGIYSENGSTWTVMLTPGSTISRNDAIGGDGDIGGNAQGGGIYNATDTWLVEDITISNNSAVGGVGGDPMFGMSGDGFGGGLYTTFGGSFSATFVTIAENDASGGAGSVPGIGEGGGAFANILGSVSLGSTIVASNTASTLNPDVSGSFFSSGYNLIGIEGAASGFGMPGDIVGMAGTPIDPLLGPLMINGGPTETHLPAAGSPAIDAADPSVFPAFDQRGMMRPIDGDAVPGAIADIGAVEVAAPMGPPAIDIEKFTNNVDADTTTGQPLIPVGNPVCFTYTVANTGGVPLDNVVVTDSVLGPIAGPVSGDLNSNSILDVGEIWMYTAMSVVTPGQYMNTGSVTADDPMSMPVTDTDDSHHFGVVVDIDVEKATDGADADAAPGPAILVGGTATFTYEVTTGSGNVALDNVKVTDDNGTPGFLPDDFNPPPVLSGGFNIGDTNMDGLLDPGETWQYSATATVTAGQYENEATAKADDATNTIPGLFTDTDLSHHFGAAPQIAMTKLVSVDGGTTFFDANSPTGPTLLDGFDAPEFKFEVTLGTGAGAVPLSNVAVTDSDLGVIAGPTSGDAGTPGVLEPGETWVYTATGVWSAGQNTNTGSADGDFTDSQSNTGAAPTAIDDANYFGAVPQIEITKFVSVDGGTTFFDANSPTGPTLLDGFDPPEFKFEVTLGTGAGAVPLSGVVVSDSVLGTVTGPASGDAGIIGLLEAGETWVYTATGTWSAGQNTNTGQADGSFTDDATNMAAAPTASDEANYIGAVTGINLEKLVSVDGGATFVDADAAPGPNLFQSAAVDPQFRFVLTNTGNVGLSNISLSDTDFGALIPPTPGIAGGDLDNDGILDTTETWTVEVTGAFALGQHTNTGSASGDFDDDDGNNDAANADNDANYFGAAVMIDIQKLTNGVDADSDVDPLMPQIAPGDAVTFDYLVRNLGNVPLSNVQVSDDNGTPLLPGDDFNPPPVLSGGFNVGDTNMNNILETTEVWEYQFVTTAEDLNVVIDFDTDGFGAPLAAGTIIDTEYANLGLTISADEIPITGMNRAMIFDSSAPTAGDTDLGTPNASFAGPGIGAGGAAGAIGENRIAQGNILIVSDDLVPGDPNAANTGTVTFTWATPVRLNNVHLLDVDSAGANTIDLYDSGGFLISSNPIPPVGNNGFQIVVFNEPFVAKMEVIFGTGPIDKVGIAQVDYDLTFGNLATGTGQFNPTATDTDPSHYRNPLEASIDIEKSTQGLDADSPTGPVLLTGTQADFEYVVTPTGDVPLLPSSGDRTMFVADDNGTPGNPGDDFFATYVSGDLNNNGILELNERWIYSANRTVTPGQFTNIGSVEAVDATGQVAGTATDSDASNHFGTDPDIDVEKLVSVDGGATFVDADSITGPALLDGFDAPQFKFIVTNTGNVDLANVTLDDDVLDLNGAAAGTAISIGTLAVGADFQTTITAAWAAGQQTNTATAEGDFTDDDGNNESVDDTDAANYLGAVPQIEIQKLVSVNGGTIFVDADSPTGPTLVSSGPAPEFKFEVTLGSGAGAVALDNVTVTDSDLGAIAGPASGDDGDGILEAGETWVYLATGTWAAGQQTNTGSADGNFTDDGGNTAAAPTATDAANYFGAVPQIEIQKLVSVDGGTIFVDADSPTGPTLVSSGPAPEFKFEVTLGSGAGAVALDNVEVSDPSLGGAIAGPASGDDGDGILEAGETWVYLATGTWAAGQQTNTGSADGDFTDDGGTTKAAATANDDANYFGAAAAIDIEKATNGVDADAPTGPILPVGSTATFTYVITNNGNVDLDINDITVTDSVLGVITNIVDQGDGDTLLEVGESWEYEATAIVSAGQYMNTGSVTADYTDDGANTVQATEQDDSHYFGVLPQVDLEKFTRVDTNPIDIQKLVRVEAPAVQGDVCDVLGNPVAITFQYLPGGTVSTAQDPSKAYILFDGAVDNDGVSFVVVSDQGNANKALNGDGKIFFSGHVAFEEYFNANEDYDSFGSSTYIHFFDDSWGGLLQTVTYHTSCSQPIQLGDVVGNATVAGYEGDSGSAAVVDLGPGINDEDPDRPTGPQATPGDTVVFTYVVSNPISGTQISNIQVTDQVLAPVADSPFSPDAVLDGAFNVGDSNTNYLLDSGEQWLYTSHMAITESTPTGQHIDKATVEGNGGALFDLDPAHFTVAAAPPVQGDVCDVLGNPVGLTFKYVPSTTVSTAQDYGKAKILVQGGVDDDEVSYVIVTDKSNAYDALSGAGKRFFQGYVAFNSDFEANEDVDSFGSTTFIHFFDNAHGGLLQSVTYHTSCSQPIQLGDVIGNATLVAYEGESGSAALPPPPVTPPPVDLGSGIIFATDDPFNPSDIGEDADSPTGPIAQLGDKVTYTYEVSNPGLVALTLDDLVDDNETPGDTSDDFTPAPVLVGGFNYGDVNMNDLLDPGEVWYFQVMQIATQPGQHMNTAEVTAEDVALGLTVTDEDSSHHLVNPLAIEKYVSVPAEPQGGDVCDTLGHPVALTFQYVPGTTVNTAQDYGKAKILFQGGVDNDGESFVVVTDRSNASEALSGNGKQFFRGNVAFDALFEANEATDSFGSATYIYFFDDATGGLLQSSTYHTSCSQPIQLGDVIGNASLIGYDGESGSANLPAGGLGDPADSPTGPVVLEGDEVTFNFEVTNLGNVDLTNVQVSDSQLGPVTDFVDMGDGDNLLEPGETWILTISYIADDPGQQMNIGTVTANSVQDPSGDPLSQSDPAYHYVECVKFFVPDKDDDATYRYTESGQAIDDIALQGNNNDARGATALADGSRLWVLDKDPNKNVYVYDGNGSSIGAWQAKKTFAEGGGTLPDKVEGIATDGTDVWIVDKDKGQVYYYSGGADFLAGSHKATSRFSLHSKNDHAYGVTTDGASIWVVDDDGSNNRVFKYSVSGNYLGSWAIDPANDHPRGITIDAAGGTSIWIVDQDADQIFQYDGATGLTSGSKTVDFVYDLDPSNDKAEGIAAAPCIPAGNTGIDIEKFTNGVNADAPGDAPQIAPGAPVTWTYEVTNTGQVPLALNDVEIVDDAGTPGNLGDDFSITSGDIVLDPGSDVGSDGILSPGEMWTFEASGIAQDLSTSGASTTIDTTGSSSQDGPNGNIRTFSAGGISVNASAFSRDSHGAWEEAYLGAYSGGLGVTDNSEGDGRYGRHRVDNLGRLNYVLIAFSENVIVDQAYLDSVKNDSDLSVWIGTIPGAFTSPVTLSDAVLSSLDLNEVNNVTNGYARWADVNSGEVAGNVLVLAASIEDTTPDDEFKIRTLDIQEAGTGVYENIAVVTAANATDADSSYYTNLVANPGIDIEKFTNGVNADSPNDAPQISPGATVTWTYEVTNTGNVPYTPGDIEIVDDAGTPGVAADDFSIASGDIVLDSGSDVGSDGILSPGEVWTFEATGIAQELSSAGASTTIDMTGSSSQDGPNGNIRTFSADGISVNASAFSRDSHGVWEEAYLGDYSSGLGVTDNSEGDGRYGRHRVDNIGRLNYVLFAFSENVIVDQAYLDSVKNDSDLSVWIGTIPGAFTSPVTLSDAVLSSLDLHEVNNVTNGYARWADVNSGEVAGNVLVLAASIEDTTPDDEFKIKTLDIQEAGTGVYENIAVVTAGNVTDDDLSHYANLVASPGIDIEKFTNGVNADSPNDAPQISPGATVTWTYEVTNTGNVPYTPGDIEIVDDAGTPGVAGDDFSIASGDIVLDSGSDVGSDGILSPGETWTFEATGIAQKLSSAGASTTIDTTGSSSQDGPNGNIRTFSAGGVSVNASAFSRDSHGVWEEAYLGDYSSGLGVTDNSEGDGRKGRHRVDNIGRLNYVLFAFSENVIVDQAYLDSVKNDSDLSVWIGTIPGAFTSPVTLSDAVLSSLDLHEVNNVTNGYARWADVNSSEVAGNVLVLAASIEDTTPDDQFKIKTLDVQEAGTGVYENIAVVTAGNVTDDDPSHYTNPVAHGQNEDDPAANPSIDIEKLTNGVDADSPSEAAEIAPGATVTWTYKVTNTGNVPFTPSDIEIVDDAGTAGVAGDDFSIASGDIVLDSGSDVGGDGILSPGEAWTFEATGIAQKLSSAGASATIDMTGRSSQDGPNGNIRTFSAGGISVNASAFSLDSHGVWEEAYLGAYSSGLGVTDNSEGDGRKGRHRVDNIGRLNYVLFAFSENVIVDQAYLDSVKNDSDLSVWIGTIPSAFTSPVTLNDALLNSLDLNEVNNATNGDARWADVNSGDLAGNVLVLAASVEDTTPDDQFKIKSLEVHEAGTGIYENIAVVSVGALSDSDPSHYRNPTTNDDSVVGHGEGTADAPPALKRFFVVDAKADKSFAYAADGEPLDNHALSDSNINPRGITATADGQTRWVIDNDGSVFVYDAGGNSLGQWHADSLSKPQGIATNEVDIWVVDNGTDKVYFYADAAARLADHQAPDSSFALANGNDRPTGITMWGQTIWVVNDGTRRDDVFVYDISGKLQGSWRLRENVLPRGITINPGDVNNIWIVDNLNDQVLEFVGGAFLTTKRHAPDAIWQLESGNRVPQGIADPPPPAMPAVTDSAVIAVPWNLSPESFGDADESPLGAIRRDTQRLDVAHQQQAFLADRFTVGVRPASLAAQAADDSMADYDDFDAGLDIFDRLDDDALFGDPEEFWGEFGITAGQR